MQTEEEEKKKETSCFSFFFALRINLTVVSY